MLSRAVGREDYCRQTSLACVGSARSVWATLGLPRSRQRELSRPTLLRLQVALQGNCLKRALGCVHFPGLSCSGSGSRVLHKGADSAGPAFCGLSRSEQLRRPGAWPAHTPQVGRASHHLLPSPPLAPSPRPSRWVSWVFSWVRRGGAVPAVACVSSVELTSGCDPPADVCCLGSREDVVRSWEPARSSVEGAVFRLWLAPACLPASGGAGPGHCRLALLWYSPSALLCERPSSALG